MSVLPTSYKILSESNGSESDQSCLYFIHLKKDDIFMMIIRLQQTSHTDSIICLYIYIFAEYCAS